MTATSDDGRGLGKTLRFMQKLWALVHALDAKSKRMQRGIGITGPQRLALRIIGRHPGIAAGDLAALLCMHPSTLTGVLARLEDGEFIQRAPDPNDRRRSRLTLTRRGRSRDGDRADTVEAAVRRALARCEPSVVEAGSKLLETIVEELQDDARVQPGNDD